ncbi:MAG: winged helix-turn-helix domain-containing protein [Pseudomonadota bacterium]
MTYRFENFELDLQRAELRRDDAPIPVEPRVFDLLRFLVEERGRVVTRSEIHAAIWGERIVSDAALSSRIRDARKVLGDDGAAQRLIKTVQRKGLRFVGAVTDGTGNATVAQDDVLDRPAVAVLLLECQSDDGDRFFADALTDEIVAALSAWRYFPVISRQTTFRLRDAPADPQTLATLTGARYVLSGAFRTAGSRIKVLLAVTDTELGQ